MNTRKCVVCKMEHFEKDFGLNRLNQPYRSCVKCRENSKIQYLNNKDKIREQQKQYHEDNKDKIKNRVKQYYEGNKDKILEQNKQYHEDNQNKIKEYKKQYHKKHYNSNLEKIVKSKIRGNIKSDIKHNRLYNEEDYITIEFIKDLLIKCNNCCCLCSKQLKLTNYEYKDAEQFSIDRLDNKMPHIKSNCQITCWNCNFKKR